jgi:hypothetical protein
MRKLFALTAFLAIAAIVSAASITIDSATYDKDKAVGSKSANQVIGFVEIPEEQISIAGFLLDSSGNSLKTTAAQAFDGAKGKFAKVTVNVGDSSKKSKLKLQGGAEYESMVELKFGTGEATGTGNNYAVKKVIGVFAGESGRSQISAAPAGTKVVIWMEFDSNVVKDGGKVNMKFNFGGDNLDAIVGGKDTAIISSNTFDVPVRKDRASGMLYGIGTWTLPELSKYDYQNTWIAAIETKISEGSWTPFTILPKGKYGKSIYLGNGEALLAQNSLLAMNVNGRTRKFKLLQHGNVFTNGAIGTAIKVFDEKGSQYDCDASVFSGELLLEPGETKPCWDDKAHLKVKDIGGAYCDGAVFTQGSVVTGKIILNLVTFGMGSWIPIYRSCDYYEGRFKIIPVG